MPKSVKEVLLECENYESLKGFYSIIPAIESVVSNIDEAKANFKLDCSALNESADRMKSLLSIIKGEAQRCIHIGHSTIQGLNEAKQFDEDTDFAHFSHGLITCYIDPAVNRFVLTKDSRNGLKNYDVISAMTKNDLKNIIKCCNDMLADVKAKSVPEEEPAKEE